jgi:hypothetical protein
MSKKKKKKKRNASTLTMFLTMLIDKYKHSIYRIHINTMASSGSILRMNE